LAVNTEWFGDYGEQILYATYGCSVPELADRDREDIDWIEGPAETRSWACAEYQLWVYLGWAQWLEEKILEKEDYIRRYNSLKSCRETMLDPHKARELSILSPRGKYPEWSVTHMRRPSLARELMYYQHEQDLVMDKIGHLWAQGLDPITLREMYGIPDDVDKDGDDWIAMLPQKRIGTHISVTANTTCDGKKSVSEAYFKHTGLGMSEVEALNLLQRAAAKAVGPGGGY
jgi:hypothetical protein